MKRLFAILLCMVLLFAAGCTQDESIPTEEPTVATEATETTEAPTEPSEETEPIETEPPAPQTVSASALADHVDVVLMTVDRDTVVEIAGEFSEDYYVVRLETGYGLIEKRLVRPEGEVAYEQWDGYAYSGAEFYTNYHLIPDETTRELAMNTQLVILDSLGECVVVQYGDEVGYMRPDEISRNYIRYTPGSGSADGGDISLSDRGGMALLSTLAPQAGEVTGTAVVLANGAEILLGWYDREEEVLIISEEGFAGEKEGWYAVYAEGLWGYVRQELVALEGAEAYLQWDGYTRYQAAVYGNYYLSGNPVMQPNSNTVVTVLQDLGTCYLVSIGEQIGYMAKGEVSESYINYSSGGGEWSDPVM